MDTLHEICPPGVPTKTIWAGYQDDLRWDMPPDYHIRENLGIRADQYVVVYTGNVHRANRDEVASLYRAVWYLNQHGFPTKLIRTGTDHASFLEKSLARIRQEFCIELGHVPRRRLPEILSIADILIQPGIPGRFNNCRFPSKIPEYLASGKPVILPRANIGLYLKNMEECLWLEQGDAPDIAQKAELLMSDELLRKKIGKGGHAFAENNLRWEQIAQKLFSFYSHTLDLRDKQ